LTSGQPSKKNKKKGTTQTKVYQGGKKTTTA